MTKTSHFIEIAFVATGAFIGLWIAARLAPLGEVQSWKVVIDGTAFTTIGYAIAMARTAWISKR